MADNEPSPYAAASVAIARVFAATAAMALPGIAGSWVDQKLGTSWIGVVGFIVGPPLGLGYLIAVYRQPKPRRDPTQSD